jgi:hypothetical protein
MSRNRAISILGLAAVALIGCDVTSPPASTPTHVSPSPAGAASSPSAPASAPPATADVQWISPKAGARITSYTTTLSARVTHPELARVRFRIASGGRSRHACSATIDASGAWSCSVDLLKRSVAPGTIGVSIVALDGRGTTIKASAKPRAAVYAVVPPKPGEATFTVVSRKTHDDGGSTEVDRISWVAPTGYATEFRLYGVKACPNDSEEHDGEPCLVEGTRLNAGWLTLIKKVDGSSRSVLIRNEVPPDACGPTLWCSPYFALVLGAFNAYGHSVYAIPISTTVCFGCTY